MENKRKHFAHKNIINTGMVRTIFIANTAPGKRSNVILYVAVYSGTTTNISKVQDKP